MIKEKVGDMYTLDSDPIPFNFATGFEDAKRPKPNIEIDFERSRSGGWCLIPGGGNRKARKLLMNNLWYLVLSLLWGT